MNDSYAAHDEVRTPFSSLSALPYMNGSLFHAYNSDGFQGQATHSYYISESPKHVDQLDVSNDHLLNDLGEDNVCGMLDWSPTSFGSCIVASPASGLDHYQNIANGTDGSEKSLSSPLMLPHMSNAMPSIVQLAGHTLPAPLSIRTRLFKLLDKFLEHLTDEVSTTSSNKPDAIRNVRLSTIALVEHWAEDRHLARCRDMLSTAAQLDDPLSTMYTEAIALENTAIRPNNRQAVRAAATRKRAARSTVSSRTHFSSLISDDHGSMATGVDEPDQSILASDLPCVVPNCVKRFKTVYNWSRHQTAHFPRWTCMPDGTHMVDGHCAICGANDVSRAHRARHPKLDACLGKPLSKRSFRGKDKLCDHIQVHLDPVVSELPDDQRERRKALLDTWQRDVGLSLEAFWCGFCEIYCDSWKERQDHILQHLKNGASLATWRPIL